MRWPMALTIIVLAFAAVGRAMAEDQPKPAWRDVGRQVVVFGDVERVGFYSITDRPISLKQLVVAAGLRPGKGVMVIVHRPTGDGARMIQVDATRIVEDGDIPLQANDVIQVTAPKDADKTAA